MADRKIVNLTPHPIRIYHPDTRTGSTTSRMACCT
jgi:hypothetical protein